MPTTHISTGCKTRTRLLTIVSRPSRHAVSTDDLVSRSGDARGLARKRDVAPSGLGHQWGRVAASSCRLILKIGGQNQSLRLASDVSSSMLSKRRHGSRGRYAACPPSSGVAAIATCAGFRDRQLAPTLRSFDRPNPAPDSCQRLPGSGLIDRARR